MSRSKDERIIIRPHLVDGLSSVKCSYASVLGKISSQWRQEDGATSIDIAVPPGVTATPILPVKVVSDILNIHPVKATDRSYMRRGATVRL